MVVNMKIVRGHCMDLQVQRHMHEEPLLDKGLIPAIFSSTRERQVLFSAVLT